MIIIMIGGRFEFYPNPFKSVQNATGIEAWKPAANGRYWVWTLPFYYLRFSPEIIGMVSWTLSNQLINQTIYVPFYYLHLLCRGTFVLWRCVWLYVYMYKKPVCGYYVLGRRVYEHNFVLVKVLQAIAKSSKIMMCSTYVQFLLPIYTFSCCRLYFTYNTGNVNKNYAVLFSLKKKSM